MSTIVFVIENEAAANEITHLSAEVNISIVGLYFVHSASHFSLVLNHQFLKKLASMQKKHGTLLQLMLSAVN